jgi:putative phosphoribosyl transferase
MRPPQASRRSELLLPFRDRRDAGRMLAACLQHYERRPATVVLGMPRGGVVVAGEIAEALGLPLDVVIARRLRAPGNPEHAVGAIAEGGTPYLDEKAVRLTGASEAYIAREIEHQREEIARRQRRLRGGRPLLLPGGVTVILVDDGVATGSTALAAIHALRLRGIARLVFAVPVAAPDTAVVLREMVDELLVLATPRYFHAVGAFYEDFGQVPDDEVVEALRHAHACHLVVRGNEKEVRDALA